MINPLCFVLMPFGVKPTASGRSIDFDLVYTKLIKPAIAAAGMDPVRADGEEAGGIVHKPMFERLLLCDHAVADLTTGNANVFYELGVRYAVRPHVLSWAGTVVIDGETYGWAEFPDPPGPPVVDGNFGRFVEYWTIFTLDRAEDLTSAACDPDRVLLAGDNTGWGSTTGNVDKADGTVTFADPLGPFADVDFGSRMLWRGKVLGGPTEQGSEFKATLHILRPR